MFLGARPFGKASEIIFRSWFAATSRFVSHPAIHWYGNEFAASIAQCFSELGQLPTVFDPHLATGRYGSIRQIGSRSNRKKKQDLTRPYLLLLKDFTSAPVTRSHLLEDTSESDDSFNRPRQLLWSPLYFLRRMLTSPDYLTSDAYAHAIIRAEIFSAALSWPVNRRQAGAPHEVIKKIIGFEKISASLHKADRYRANNDTFHMADQTDVVVGQLLASLGLAYFSFAPRRQHYTSKRKHELAIMGRDRFISDCSLIPPPGMTYEIRFPEELDKFPSPSEVMNLLDGIPIPIPGADGIFAGGLRMSEERGVVARVSGLSGTGKTTFALGIAASLAPLGTRTCYLSCEEDPRDLSQRILTLTPPFLARMASFKNTSVKWFAAVHLDHPDPEVNRADALGFVDYVRAEADVAGVNLTKERTPGLVPFFVVLDGVHELISRPSKDGRDDVGEMRELVDEFRKLGVFVMILTAQTDDHALKELDYLVDVVITLEHEDRGKIADEPKRKFVLHKTRLQHAWSGAHQLHISKRDGLKLYPQLPAQLEPYTTWRWKPIRRERWFDMMQTAVRMGKGTDPHDLAPLVRIFERSQILIAGRGSSGKAGFGLKLLSSPILPEDQSDQNTELFSLTSSEELTARRILIASFLYPDEYYQELASRLRNSNSDRTSYAKSDCEIDTIAFYPGFITPEVLVSKILTRIKSAELDGVPYHGVMIDGLHNVFLQFPRLQENILFWPILYETFRIIGLTVLTTHTQFAIRGLEHTPTLSSEVETVTHRIGPLLQAIVNAADFYINVTHPGDDLPSAQIEVVSALGQPIRRQQFFWNPQSLLVEYRK